MTNENQNIEGKSMELNASQIVYIEEMKSKGHTGCSVTIGNTQIYLSFIPEKNINTCYGANNQKETTTGSPMGAMKKNLYVHNCVFIGYHAGENLIYIEDQEGVVIIGDNIKDLDRDQKEDVIFIGEKFAIGKTIQGKPCNLYDILLKESESKMTSDLPIIFRNTKTTYGKSCDCKSSCNSNTCISRKID